MRSSSLFVFSLLTLALIAGQPVAYGQATAAPDQTATPQGQPMPVPDSAITPQEPITPAQEQNRPAQDHGVPAQDQNRPTRDQKTAAQDQNTSAQDQNTSSEEQNAPTTAAAPFEIAGGFSYLTNAFNGVPGHQGGLPGWDASVAFRSWNGLRPKIDFSGYTGTNYGAQENGYLITGGVQYEHRIGRESIFAEALVGEVFMNKLWGPNGGAGQGLSFVSKLGGGLDTPIDKHVAIRVQADYIHDDLQLAQSANNATPVSLPGLPKSSFALASGVVWTPRLGSDSFTQPPALQSKSSESELQFEGLNSFGHINFFASSWWSYLLVAGVEYDRHSWGIHKGIRMDYVAEVLPLSIVKQPSNANVWGIPASRPIPFTNNYGLGLSPFGLRMLWRDGQAWKPYLLLKQGVIVFRQKALTQNGSYINFSLQQGGGVQFRLTDRWDARAGFAYFHFSNAFIVPGNPGIDEMSYNAALTYHLGKKSSGD